MCHRALRVLPGYFSYTFFLSVYLACSYSKRTMAQTWWPSNSGRSGFHTSVRPSQPRTLPRIFHQGSCGASGTSGTKRPRRRNWTYGFHWHARMARSPWEAWPSRSSWTPRTFGTPWTPRVKRRSRIRRPPWTGWAARISRLSSVEDYHGYIYTLIYYTNRKLKYLIFQRQYL